MPAPHQRDFLQKLRVFLFFIEFNILILIRICRQKRTHFNPGLTPGLPPAPQPEPQPTSWNRRKPPNSWVMPWILQRHLKGCYRNLLTGLIHTNITGYQNFVRMPPAFFYLIEERIHHHIEKSVTNFRKSLEVRLKLAVMLRLLAI